MAASGAPPPSPLFQQRPVHSVRIFRLWRLRASVQATLASRLPTRRKNRLREKIIKPFMELYSPSKTLDDPDGYIQFQHPPFGDSPIHLGREEEFKFRTPCPPPADDRLEPGLVEDPPHQMFEETCLTVTKEELELRTDVADLQAFPEIEPLSGKSIFNLALALLGLFVVNTAVALWIFGAGDQDCEESATDMKTINGKGESVNVTKYVGGYSSQRLSSKPDTVPYIDELRLNKQVMEIRAMAKAARESERKQLDGDDVGGNGDEGIDDAEVDDLQAVVQEEIDRRLVKVRKSLASPRVKSLTVNGKASEKQLNKPKGFKSPEKNTKFAKIGRKGSVENNKHNPLKGNNISEKSVKRGLVKEEGGNVWWQNLPCVFVILLRKGSDQEALGGFYSLKSPSNNEHLLSYTIAFVDRGDASNFCFLLESFFQDLSDLRADVIPLSIKELQRETASSSKQVIVVKKGQLQLYAGQPLVEVEMALRSLLD